MSPSPSRYHRFSTLLGFKKSSNTLLFLIFSLPLFLFAFSQLLQAVTLSGIQPTQTAPGEAYWFRAGHRRFGLQLHLAAILPCALLSTLQFIPRIRHSKPQLHRINGHVVLVLLLIANIGALMIGRHTFGGSITIQTIVGFLVLITSISAALAYYNIRRLQIDQHRAWMLRCFFYMGTILTARPIMAISAVIVSRIGGYFNVWPCDMIAWTFAYYGADEGHYLQLYPACADHGQSGPSAGFAPVLANIFSKTDPAQIGASFQVPVGMAFFISLVLHAVGVELYLAMTGREAGRLRVESYRRQKAAGYQNAGSAGLVPEKFGDAEPWVCPLGWEDDGAGETERLI